MYIHSVALQSYPNSFIFTITLSLLSLDLSNAQHLSIQFVKVKYPLNYLIRIMICLLLIYYYKPATYSACITHEHPRISPSGKSEVQFHVGHFYRESSLVLLVSTVEKQLIYVHLSCYLCIIPHLLSYIFNFIALLQPLLRYYASSFI